MYNTHIGSIYSQPLYPFAEADEPVKSKSKHKHKSKHSRTPSPRKKDKSPAHKKHKEEKTKHEKHRSRESKNHHNHKHHHKDKKHANEPKELPVEKETTHIESVTPEQQQQQKDTGDEKLVSEYEQFMKMVCSTETELIDSTVPQTQAPPVTSLPASSPSSFYEFSLEAKITKETPVAEPVDMFLPIGLPNKEFNKSDKSVKADKVIEKEKKSVNKAKELEAVVREQTPSPTVIIVLLFNMKYRCWCLR